MALFEFPQEACSETEICMHVVWGGVSLGTIPVNEQRNQDGAEKLSCNALSSLSIPRGSSGAEVAPDSMSLIRGLRTQNQSVFG